MSSPAPACDQPPSPIVRSWPRIEGALPAIGLPFSGGFDGILCSAGLMQLPEPALCDATMTLRALLKPDGRLPTWSWSTTNRRSIHQGERCMVRSSVVCFKLPTPTRKLNYGRTR